VAVVDVAEEVFLRTEDINQAGGETEACRTDLTDLKATKSRWQRFWNALG
jgi:hypothetical protein